MADEIERELQVVEAPRALGNDSTDSFLIPSSATELSNVEAEVDAILGQQIAAQ